MKLKRWSDWSAGGPILVQGSMWLRQVPRTRIVIPGLPCANGLRSPQLRRDIVLINSEN